MLRHRGNVGDTFDVLDGTLTAANSNLGITLNAITGTTVAAGVTVDWAGNVAEIDNLQGAGTVTNSGAAQSMYLSGTTNFSGVISGALSPTFGGNASLSGVEDYIGGATIDGSNTVANVGTYDMVGNQKSPGRPPPLSSTTAYSRRRAGAASATSRRILSTAAR